MEPLYLLMVVLARKRRNLRYDMALFLTTSWNSCFKVSPSNAQTRIFTELSYRKWAGQGIVCETTNSGRCAMSEISKGATSKAEKLVIATVESVANMTTGERLWPEPEAAKIGHSFQEAIRKRPGW